MGKRILISLILATLTQPCWAAKTGKKAAQKYFVKKTGEAPRSTASTSSLTKSDYKGLFTLSAGTLFDSQSYNWGGEQNPGGWTLQLDYHRNISSSFFSTVY